ncbi:MAG: 30S ribosomal protein S16 [Demequina sp.]
MAVKIRLKRFGKKKAPFYRVIVIDGRSKRDGKALEEIGLYHPLDNPSRIEINSERALYWLSVGAQPSDQVRALLKLTGDWGIHTGDKNAKNTVQAPEGKLSPEDTIKKIATDAEKLKAAKAEAKEKEKKEAEAEAKAAEESAPAPEAEDVAPGAEDSAVADTAPAEDAAPAAEAKSADEKVAEDLPGADEAADKVEEK